MTSAGNNFNDFLIANLPNFVRTYNLYNSPPEKKLLPTQRFFQEAPCVHLSNVNEANAPDEK